MELDPIESTGSPSTSRRTELTLVSDYLDGSNIRWQSYSSHNGRSTSGRFAAQGHALIRYLSLRVYSVTVNIESHGTRETFLHTSLAQLDT